VAYRRVDTADDVCLAPGTLHTVHEHSARPLSVLRPGHCCNMVSGIILIHVFFNVKQEHRQRYVIRQIYIYYFEGKVRTKHTPESAITLE
jgi:hypothetical protein